MVLKRAEPFNSRHMLRNCFVGAVLFAATAWVVLWQNAHVVMLFDASYVLNTAARIALGQMPYRDFPLPHAPLTFLTQAAIIRFTGRVFFHHVLYVALVGGLGTVIAWQIASEILRKRVAAAWSVALMLALPLVVLGVYCIVPNPEYDCDCGFWILVAVWLLQRVDGYPSLTGGFVAGVFACVPVFCKQNMGLPFLAAIIAAALLVLGLKWVQRRENPEDWRQAQPLVALLAGVCAALAAAALALHWTAGLGNYIQWTMRYAAQRRLPEFNLMAGIYLDPMLRWTLPCVAIGLLLIRFGGRISTGSRERSSSRQIPNPEAPIWIPVVGFALLAAPFIYALASLLIYDNADERGDSMLALWPLVLLLAVALMIVNLVRLRGALSMRAFLPLILLAAIHGTFMSQQVWGSSYGIWPLLILLIADLLIVLDGLTLLASAKWITPALAGAISITLLVCGGFYVRSEVRLSYANLPNGPPAHSTFPQLAGMSTPGPYLPEIDELLRYADARIPFNDGIVLIPGEEPFYFATGRAQHYPVLFFDPTIDPYTPAQAAALVRSHNIRWLIVKTDLQTIGDPTPDRAQLISALMGNFALATHLHGYDVYRSKSAE